jgi:quercetin dioxygenase-like cupin family protein
MKPIVGTPSCLYHHQRFVISGQLEFETDDGAHRIARPGDVFDVPPGHNAWAVGDDEQVGA